MEVCHYFLGGLGNNTHIDGINITHTSVTGMLS